MPGTTPPHDITGKSTRSFLPQGEGAEPLKKIMLKARKIIKESSQIKKAKEKFKGTPNSIWIWGGGKKPRLNSLSKKFGLNGYTISAVDLIHGLGKAAGLSPLEVKNTTGYIDTNYKGKAQALLNNINNCNFIFLHLEAPDESGHEGNLKHKIKAIQDFDKKIVGPVMTGLQKYKDFAVLIMPDHPTPLSLKTHTSDPVPFIIYNSKGWDKQLKNKYKVVNSYSEKMAAQTGLVTKGHQLLKMMLS